MHVQTLTRLIKLPLQKCDEVNRNRIFIVQWFGLTDHWFPMIEGKVFSILQPNFTSVLDLTSWYWMMQAYHFDLRFLLYIYFAFFLFVIVMSSFGLFRLNGKNKQNKTIFSLHLSHDFHLKPIFKKEIIQIFKYLILSNEFQTLKSFQQHCIRY